MSSAPLSWRVCRSLCIAGSLLPVICAIPPSLAAEPALTAEQLAPIRHALSELIRAEMKSNGVEGLSIALVEDQRIAWAEGFGHADIARRLPAQANTLYAVGGLSTLLTATAMLQLADQGAIDLDQPVKKYLPEFSIRSRFANTPAISTRQLLSHHAGLPAMHFKGMWTPKPEPLAAFVARLKNEYVASPPGLVFSPSFPGYDVLGRVLETHCQKPFAVCMHEQLLAPLGMLHSTFDVEHAHKPLLAMHYLKDKPIASQTVRDTPAAGLVSSVAELARFMQMLNANGKSDGKQILKPGSVSEMLRPQNSGVALDLDTRVGLGWRLSGVRLPRTNTVAWLSNESPFSRGRMMLAPEHKLGVIVLTNSSNSTEVVEKISERLMELVLQTRPSGAPPAARQTAVTQPAAAPARDDLVGHYATPLGLISVKLDNDRYRAQMLGKSLRLIRQPEGLYAPEYRLLGLFPIPISVMKEARMTTAKVGGRHLAVAYYRNQAHRLGERIAPVRLSALWRKRLGDYQPVERDPLLEIMKFGTVALIHADGLLYFRYRVPGWLGLTANVPVRPVSDTELVIEGTGWLLGETVQVVQHDGQEHLRYSGYELRLLTRP